MKKFLTLVISLVFILTAIFFGKYFPSSHSKTPIEIYQDNAHAVDTSGNQKIRNFRQAKKILETLYEEDPYTFYCGCYFFGKKVDFASCGYRPRNDTARAYRIEWEHIVPASDFGRSFSSWRKGDPRCVDKNGSKFKGRKCANLVSPEFNRMEADLYNLVPSIGEINGMRKNYPMGLLSGLPNTFGQCKTKVAQNTIEPREEVRGFIARTYKYMQANYPKTKILSRKTQKLFNAWDKFYPATLAEKKRARKISKIQGNQNRFVERSSHAQASKEKS